MNKESIIVHIANLSDIENITSKTKYINIDISKPNNDIVEYFLNNGQNYSYAEKLGDRSGFIYTSYDLFKDAENKINTIVSGIDSSLNLIETIRYIYISLGKIISTDINLIEGKNEIISFNDINVTNNIWGALSKGIVTCKSCTLLFIYICSKFNIKCELVSTSVSGNIACKVYFSDDEFLIVDLFNDIHNIKCSFSTVHFDNYNNDIVIDKKIGYVKDIYANYYLDGPLKQLNGVKKGFLYGALSLSERFINIGKLNAMELSLVYKDIFSKYFSNYNVKINNFYLWDHDKKKHFVVFSYADEVYCYNYQKRKFVTVSSDDLDNNLKNEKIGIYLGENFREKVVDL